MSNINGGSNAAKYRGSNKNQQSFVLRYKAFATHLLVGAACFYGGIGVGMRAGVMDCAKNVGDEAQSIVLLRSRLDQLNEHKERLDKQHFETLNEHKELLDKQHQERLDTTAILKDEAEAWCTQKVHDVTESCNDRIHEMEELQKAQDAAEKVEGQPSIGTQRFPDGMSYFATGLAQVDRNAFSKRYDVGVPLDQSTKDKNDKVLIMYNDPKSLPNNEHLVEQIVGGGEMPLIHDLEEATQNCDVLDLVLVQQKAKRQCYAFMGQYQSFHVQKFMRLPETKGEKLDPSAPLRLVNRGAQASGRLSAKPPTKAQTLQYWSTLKTYLDTLEGVLDELKPIAEKVAKQNTVIVMVCNHGQSELLMNFVCAARSRNLDTSPVLVFATDEETKDLAEGLGLTAFFDKTNYGNAPKKAARSYGDKAFTAMMMAKVYCVQMIAMLGYDVLFQDVDMVWMKDPLDYFHDEKSPSHGFDVYFQDDGSRGIFYAPYSANTGFYYVRANDRTRNFFNSLLMAGDLVISTKSHQIALVALLSEHASLHGMKTKVLGRDTDEFPGGHAFHYRKDFMRDIFAGKVKPYIFHMSWTLNKDNKQKFFRQMGEWYLKDQCVAATAKDILGLPQEPESLQSGALLEPCCSAEPIFSCFYSDKPSKFPCKDSPTIDNGGKPFWK